MICSMCRSGEWTRIRQWYMGKRAVLWCDYCYEETTPLLVVVPPTSGDR